MKKKIHVYNRKTACITIKMSDSESVCMCVYARGDITTKLINIFFFFAYDRKGRGDVWSANIGHLLFIADSIEATSYN